MSLKVHNPADGRLVAVVADHDPESVREALTRLREAQSEWELLGADGRTRWLRRYAGWLLDNRERLASTLQTETSKPWADALIETHYAVQVLNYFAEHSAGFLARRRSRSSPIPLAHKRFRQCYRPYPVVGVISPRNFSLALSMLDAVPALAAGAAVVVKPSEFAPLATAAAVVGWDEIGAPPVFTCPTGGRATGEAVVETADYIHFTGSTRTGRTVAARAGERLIPCSLELSGKDAMIVLDDADIGRAARGAVHGAMVNAGQTCASVERVYVLEEVYEEFVGRVVAEVRALRQGAGEPAFTTDVGPMAGSAQLEIVDRHIEDALVKGADVRVGGRILDENGRFVLVEDGRYVAPTVLTDVDHTMLCMTEETCGPLLPVMKVRSEDEAVELANDSRYGLSASVWTRDRRRAERIADRLEVGTVHINDVLTDVIALPAAMSGWKDSGLGPRRGGARTVRKYCRPQTLVTNRVDLPGDPYRFPYTRFRGMVLDRALQVAGARDIRRLARAVLPGNGFRTR